MSDKNVLRLTVLCFIISIALGLWTFFVLGVQGSNYSFVSGTMAAIAIIGSSVLLFKLNQAYKTPPVKIKVK